MITSTRPTTARLWASTTGRTPAFCMRGPAQPKNCRSGRWRRSASTRAAAYRSPDASPAEIRTFGPTTVKSSAARVARWDRELRSGISWRRFFRSRRARKAERFLVRTPHVEYTIQNGERLGPDQRMMTTLLSVLLSIAVLNIRPLPQGTQLHVRLTTTVGSYASAAGSPISAVLIAPVILNGETVLPAGSILAGRVKSVTRVGLGVRHETAGLDLEFNRITPLDGETISISAQVARVDNSRERVTRDGRIQGVRSTGSLCYRVSGYIRTALQWEVHAELAEWAIRSLVMELPEPEIYYPAGVELTLALTQPLLVDAPAQAVHALADDERDEFARIAALLPYRTHTPASGKTKDRSSDLTNVLLVGSHDQIVAAFDAAGWTQPNSSSFRGSINWLRAIAELRGDQGAPMSLLLLNGSEPDMSWQKGLNDVSKRHHIRLWKTAGTWHGQELWTGAATRDIDFAYMRPGKRLSHKIEADVDQERDKVAYDLAFSSCGNVLNWTERPRYSSIRSQCHRRFHRHRWPHGGD